MENFWHYHLEEKYTCVYVLRAGRTLNVDESKLHIGERIGVIKIKLCAETMSEYEIGQNDNVTDKFITSIALMVD